MCWLSPPPPHRYNWCLWPGLKKKSPASWGGGGDDRQKRRQKWREDKREGGRREEKTEVKRIQKRREYKRWLVVSLTTSIVSGMRGFCRCVGQHRGGCTSTPGGGSEIGSTSERCRDFLGSRWGGCRRPESAGTPSIWAPEWGPI